jgi:hypothetical protein
MRSPLKPQWLTLSLLVLAAAMGTQTECAAPTAITVIVKNDFGCKVLPRAGLSMAATVPELEGKALTSTSFECDANGRLGSIVLVPKDGKTGRIAFQVVVRPDGEDPATCLDTKARGCISAKRDVAWIPHVNLEVLIDMRISCLDIPCDRESTCARGQCVAPQLDNCATPQCDEGSLVRTPSRADASTDAPNANLLPKGPIDDLLATLPVGQWLELPNTNMKAVCPAPTVGTDASALCGVAISAGGGGAFDSTRDKLIVTGGGAGSPLNNVYAFDLATMKWSRKTEVPSDMPVESGTPVLDTTVPPYFRRADVGRCGYYPKASIEMAAVRMTPPALTPAECDALAMHLDYQQPQATQVFGNLVYIPRTDEVCKTGSTLQYANATDSPEVACLSQKTNVWRRAGQNPEVAKGVAALDNKGDVWYHGSRSVARYENDTFVKKADSPVATFFKAAGDIDRKRNAFLVYDRNQGINTLVIRSLTDLAAPAEEVEGPALDAAADPIPALAYVDHLDRAYAWLGGRLLYIFDPEAKTWSALDFGGTGDPGTPAKDGSYGRFAYSKNRKLLVTVSSISSNVFVYKLPL